MDDVDVDATNAANEVDEIDATNAADGIDSADEINRKWFLWW